MNAFIAINAATILACVFAMFVLPRFGVQTPVKLYLMAGSFLAGCSLTMVIARRACR
jgi:hypothetical protein